MNEFQNNWKKTVERFGETFDDKVIFDSFIPEIKPREIINHEVILTMLYQFNVEYVSTYLPELQAIYQDITGSTDTLKLISENDYEKMSKPLYNEEREADYQFDDQLNPDFTFENFVVGNSNRIAQNASLAVSMKPGFSYSPLFIYSHSGLGKTHLLNAIGNRIKNRNENLRILYSTSEQFVNEFIGALGNHKMDEFNYKYRHVDVLLIDDIQFIASKDSSMEMFFNIFNSLQNDNKQIVITSDKHPKDLKGMENRLVSRFTNGLTVSIDTPEFETAKAILKKKIEIKNIDYPIDEDVLDHIAAHYTRDIRELEGSLNRLLFYKLIEGANKDRIDLEFALEAFRDEPVVEAGHTLTVDDIKKTVAQYYNLSVAQINSKSRTHNIIVARHIAMYLVRNILSDISFIQIGKEFGGRDHSTVMKACDKVARLLKKDPLYQEAINDIKAKLKLL